MARPGDPEVHQDDRPVVADEDVAGFDVTVDDARVVGDLERLGDPADDAERVGGAELAPQAEEARQRLAVDELHDEVGDGGVAVVDLAVVVDLDDAGALHDGDGARLAPEALAEAAVVDEVGQEDLDGDGAPQDRVRALPDVAHAAAADAAFEPVPPVQDVACLEVARAQHPALSPSRRSSRAVVRLRGEARKS